MDIFKYLCYQNLSSNLSERKSLLLILLIVFIFVEFKLIEKYHKYIMMVGLSPMGRGWPGPAQI